MIFKPYRNQDYQTIKAQLLRNGQLFEDPQFPASHQSISKYPNHEFPPQIGFSWKRPKEITQNPKFIVNDIEPKDIHQGQLGDCWFLAAAVSVAAHPKYIAVNVPKDQSFDKDYCGIFHFRFWQYGEWLDVVIDDRLPVDYSNNFIFCCNKVNKNEFWSCLLEKAYAKLVSCYQFLSGGFTQEALVDLTGGVSEEIDLRGAQQSGLQFWKFLLQATEVGSICGATLRHENAGLEHRLKSGLVNLHAYSITKIVEIKPDNKHYNSLLENVSNFIGDFLKKSSPQPSNPSNRTNRGFIAKDESEEYDEYPTYGQPAPVGNFGYDPCNPWNVVNPYNPYNPYNPNNPVKPYDPYNPYNPYNPYKPNNPLNPYDPNNPVNPYDPNNPLNPYDPNNPLNPYDPNNPLNPYDPNNPVNPYNPSVPIYPDIENNNNNNNRRNSQHKPGDSFRLIRLRNPWGNEQEWNGRWSDNSKEWQKLDASVKKELGLVKEYDGEFWMDFNDFMTNFHFLQIVHINLNAVASENGFQIEQTKSSWKCKQYDGEWIPGVNAGGSGTYSSYDSSSFWTNPQFLVNVRTPDKNESDGKATLIVSLIFKQESEIRNRNRGQYGFFPKQFRLYRVNSDSFNKSGTVKLQPNQLTRVGQSDINQQLREICQRFRVQPGSYVIIPCTYDKNIGGKFLLRLYTEESIQDNDVTQLVQNSPSTSGGYDENFNEDKLYDITGRVIESEDILDLLGRYDDDATGSTGDDDENDADWSVYFDKYKNLRNKNIPAN